MGNLIKRTFLFLIISKLVLTYLFIGIYNWQTNQHCFTILINADMRRGKIFQQVKQGGGGAEMVPCHQQVRYYEKFIAFKHENHKFRTDFNILQQRNCKNVFAQEKN